VADESALPIERRAVRQGDRDQTPGREVIGDERARKEGGARSLCHELAGGHCRYIERGGGPRDDALLDNVRRVVPTEGEVSRAI